MPLGTFTVTDDDGSGTTGTVANNAWLQSLLDLIDTALGTTAAYTPTWGSTGTANTLGNGTLTGTWHQFGRLVFYTITLTWGNSTSSGTGVWTFTLPATASLGQAGGSVLMVNAGVQQYAGLLQIVTSGTVIQPVTVDGATPVGLGASAPFAWGAADIMEISGWFFTA
jgi:hypothetical protein